MIGQGIYQFLKSLVIKERSVEKLTLSFCLGVYIAFSPFIGFHTIMVFLFGWLFSLNIAVLLAATYLINNPWTMVPVYVSDYMVGNWLLGRLYGDTTFINPAWMNWLNNTWTYYTGIKEISLWAFLVGGNFLGIILALLSYPIMKRIFQRLTVHMDIS